MANVAILALLLLAVSWANCELNPERLSIVDKNSKLGNYLVRGNLPISNEKKFQIDLLKQHLSNLTGLKKYDLVVISFLNFLTAKQTKNRYIQEKFFERHPQSGEYRSKLILGSLLDPYSYPPVVSKFLTLLTYLLDIDNIDELVTELHEEIHKSGRNKIIFIHCAAGMDRTGYVSGAYKLKYLNYSLEQVLQENSKFGGARKYMHINTYYGLKWFCFNHKDKEQCTVPN